MDDILNLLMPDEKPGRRTRIRYGTIPATYTTGRPAVHFDGESAASSKRYPHLSSYTPAANDKVLVLFVDKGGVILGRIV